MTKIQNYISAVVLLAAALTFCSSAVAVDDPAFQRKHNALCAYAERQDFDTGKPIAKHLPPDFEIGGIYPAGLRAGYGSVYYADWVTRSLQVRRTRNATFGFQFEAVWVVIHECLHGDFWNGYNQQRFARLQERHGGYAPGQLAYEGWTDLLAWQLAFRWCKKSGKCDRVAPLKQSGYYGIVRRHIQTLRREVGVRPARHVDYFIVARRYQKEGV